MWLPNPNQPPGHHEMRRITSLKAGEEEGGDWVKVLNRQSDCNLHITGVVSCMTSNYNLDRLIFTFEINRRCRPRMVGSACNRLVDKNIKFANIGQSSWSAFNWVIGFNYDRQQVVGLKSTKEDNNSVRGFMVFKWDFNVGRWNFVERVNNNCGEVKGLKWKWNRKHYETIGFYGGLWNLIVCTWQGAEDRDYDILKTLCSSRHLGIILISCDWKTLRTVWFV